MKRLLAALPVVGLIVLGLGVQPASATAFNAEITSPTTVTQVAPGGTVEISVQFQENHVCGPYYSNIYIGGTAAPLVQEEFQYVPGVDIPDVCAGPTRTHNFTHTLTVPADAAPGVYDVDLFVDEDFFGTRCCGDWAETRVGVIEVLPPEPLGACPAEPSGYQLVQMSHAADVNGDGFVCVKETKGKGNQGNNTNIKDNDSDL